MKKRRKLTGKPAKSVGSMGDGHTERFQFDYDLDSQTGLPDPSDMRLNLAVASVGREEEGSALDSLMKRCVRDPDQAFLRGPKRRRRHDHIPPPYLD